VLRRTGRADFVAFPADSSFDSTLARFVRTDTPLAFVVCRGRRLRR
jgi:hypothetical protein